MSLLANWLDEGACHLPSITALLTPRGEWSYAGLAALARRGAGLLRARGVQAGDIAVFAAGGSDLALAALACSAAGAALWPLDPQSVDRAWPRLQALGDGRLKRLATLPPHWPAGGVGRAATLPDDLALVVATSGSSGEPKAVMLSNANLDAAARAANQRLSLAAGDLWLGCLPLHHIGGLSLLYRCLRAGASLLLHEGFSAAAVWRDLNARPVSHLSLVPAMLARLLDVAGAAAVPASLRHVLVGGAALSQSLGERALASGWPICPSWGMSETAAQAATLLRPGKDWRGGQVGPLLSGLQARVADDGRLHLRGAQVMVGYLNPERRPGVGLDDGWLPTADLGRIDAAGWLTVLGRADELLISGGVKVHPSAVEACLAACPGVSDVAVTAVPDAVWGDVLVALVVGQTDNAALDAWMRQHLIGAHRPRRVLRLDRLPRNAMGKLERRQLRALVDSPVATAR